MDWSVGARWSYGTTRVIGLGFLAGAVEVAVHAFTLKLPLTVVEFLVMACAAVLVMGFAGLMAALPSGVVHFIGRNAPPSRTIAWQFALTGFLLISYYLWQLALGVWTEQGRLVAALAVAAMPIGFAGVIYYNALFWLKKVEIGVEYRVPFPVSALVVSAVVSLIAAVGYQARDTGGSGALDGDRNVLLITIDTLRRDHVGVYGEAMAVATPRMDALAAEGVVYMDAVAPMPETAPSHATMMTGKHPLRHGVLSNGHELTGGHKTLAEVLEEEGYATGAFVSSFAVHSRTGLDQGFRVFDDDLSPLPGLAQVDALGKLMRVWMVVGDPASTPWMLERGGKQTNARFVDWLDGHDQVPFFAWVHYMEPHAPYEPWGLPGYEANGPVGQPVVDHREKMAQGDAAIYTDQERDQLRSLYAEEVAYTDTLVGEVLDELDRRGLADNTLVILTADHGEMLGEHGLDFLHHGLYDEALRVPLIIRAPGARIGVKRVEPQVRLMDLVNTVLDYLKLDELESSEGVDLMGYAEGVRHKTMW
jgi:arylsulfatase A-like enzyme